MQTNSNGSAVRRMKLLHCARHDTSRSGVSIGPRKFENSARAQDESPGEDRCAYPRRLHTLARAVRWPPQTSRWLLDIVHLVGLFLSLGFFVEESRFT